jgi:arginase
MMNAAREPSHRRAAALSLLVLACASAPPRTASVAASSPMNRKLVVLDAPTNLGLRPPRPGVVPGVAGMPRALRARRLVQRLGATDGGAVESPPYSADPDFAVGFRNGGGIRLFSERLAERTRPLVRSGAFPIVLGGDCSVLVGTILGLKPLGRYGLVFIDGHDDFSPVRDPDKFRGLVTAAGQDLALATGRGPAALADIQGARPYVAEADVVVFGMYHDPSDAKDYDLALLDSTSIRQRRIDWIRAVGVREAAEETMRWLESKPLDGYWIHVDADVLDQSVMPAVDSPNPNGLYFDELAQALQIFLSSPKAVGLEITIYDPELDPDGVYGDRLADTIVRAFGEARPGSAPPRLRFAAELTALNREPTEDLALYGQFVGDWEFERTKQMLDGRVERARGQWHFGWILEGRAIQDVFMVPGRRQREAGAPLTTYGVVVRTYDPKRRKWRITWHDALRGSTITLSGERRGDEIVQEARDEQGRRVRWVFSSIRADSFRWRLEASPDEGKTWNVTQELVARRAER